MDETTETNFFCLLMEEMTGGLLFLCHPSCSLGLSMLEGKFWKLIYIIKASP